MIMDFRTMILVSFAAILTVLVANTEGRNKKVVIHVPYKVKKIKHTHTVYKTIHHHHTHHDHEHGILPSEEHEHFHHIHLHDELPLGTHSQPSAGIGIPDFLPDDPEDIPLDTPDFPPRTIPNRHVIPLYIRNK